MKFFKISLINLTKPTGFISSEFFKCIFCFINHLNIFEIKLNKNELNTQKFFKHPARKSIKEANKKRKIFYLFEICHHEKILLPLLCKSLLASEAKRRRKERKMISSFLQYLFDSISDSLLLRLSTYSEKKSDKIELKSRVWNGSTYHRYL